MTRRLHEMMGMQDAPVRQAAEAATETMRARGAFLSTEERAIALVRLIAREGFGPDLHDDLKEFNVRSLERIGALGVIPQDEAEQAGVRQHIDAEYAQSVKKDSALYPAKVELSDEAHYETFPLIYVGLRSTAEKQEKALKMLEENHGFSGYDINYILAVGDQIRMLENRQGERLLARVATQAYYAADMIAGEEAYGPQQEASIPQDRSPLDLLGAEAAIDFELSACNLEAKAMRSMLEKRFVSVFGDKNEDERRARFRALNVGEQDRAFEVAELPYDTYVMDLLDSPELAQGVLYGRHESFDGQLTLSAWMEAPNRTVEKTLRRDQVLEMDQQMIKDLPITIGMRVDRGESDTFLIPLAETRRHGEICEFAQPAGIDAMDSLDSDWIQGVKGQQFMSAVYRFMGEVLEFVDGAQKNEEKSPRFRRNMPAPERRIISSDETFLGLTLHRLDASARAKVVRVLEGLATKEMRSELPEMRARTEVAVLEKLRYDPDGRMIALTENGEEKEYRVHAFTRRKSFKGGPVERANLGYFIEGPQVKNPATGLYESTFDYAEVLDNKDIKTNPHKMIRIKINELDEVQVFDLGASGIAEEAASDEIWEAVNELLTKHLIDPPEQENSAKKKRRYTLSTGPM